jgi:eukaryotic-like serine/threonine-protein kinase
MDAKRWDKIVELFHQAREQSGADRDVLLDSACRDNRSLRVVIEQMLRDDEADSSFLNRPAGEALISSEAEVVKCAAGARFGRYEIVASVGRGGMGEVWAARDAGLGRMVALKFLAPSLALAGDDYLTQEARSASALNHPNIVTVHEVIYHENMPILVMELVDGESLRALCGTPQPATKVIDLGEQIATALAAAHSAGLMHRDIKPENILLRRDGYVKVVDFGLAGGAAAEENARGAQMLAGTPAYMSSEQLGQGEVSEASDVFSMGLVLYELAVGRHPFRRESWPATAEAIRRDRPPAPSAANPSIPESLDRLILRVLGNDPAGRPTAAAVAAELSAIRESLVRKSSTGRQETTRRRWLGGVVAAGALPAGIFAWSAWERRDREEFRDLRIQPLTSQAGWEDHPALSPDGRSIAFTWSERLDRPRQIYVARHGTANPVRITHSESGHLGYLAWSPDAGRIAFKRQFGTTGAGAIFSIPALGGEEQKLVDLEDADLTSAIDWSPDGTTLAFSEVIPGLSRKGIYLYNRRSGEKKRLTTPPPETWGDWNPHFSPDGRTIAFKRVTGFWADDLYLIPAAGGTPRRMTTTRRGIWGHAWTADGKSLIVSCQRSGTVFGIWRFPLADPSRPERIEHGGVDAIMPATALRAQRLAWVNQLWDLNIYRAATRGGAAPEKLIASTARDEGAVYGPDGRIALISDRSGSREIWIANADGSAQQQVTNFQGPQIDHLQWSPDGKQLLFDARPNSYPDIFILECDGSGRRGEPQRVSAASPAEAPSWSSDGTFIYFTSDRSGNMFEIWKLPAAGGSPMRVTHGGGYLSRESRDGRWLYFARNWDNNISRIAGSKAPNASNHGEHLLIGPPYKVQVGAWDLSEDEIFFVDRPTEMQPTMIRARHLVTGKVRAILELSDVLLDRPDVGLSLSPDARWLVYSKLDRSGSNVMVGEKAR